MASAQDIKMYKSKKEKEKRPPNRRVIPFIWAFLVAASCFLYSTNAVDSPVTDTTDTNIKGSSSI